MRTSLLLLSLLTLPGCVQPIVESQVPATSALHGGILIPLTDKQAYVELLNGKREKKGKAFETTLIAYLLQTDHESAYPESPQSFAVKIGTPTGDQTLTLKPSPDSADPRDSARFVSILGPFELNQIGGEVTVQVGGKTLSGTFRGPR